MRNSSNTIIDFYEGAYGSTVRIDIQTVKWLGLFLDSILLLKNGFIHELDLLSLSDTEKDEIGGLKLILGTQTKMSRISSNQLEFNSFIWIVDTETIERIIDATNNFIVRGESGHYYLYEDNGIILEFAYKE